METDGSDDAERIKSGAWQQGSVISPELVRRLLDDRQLPHVAMACNDAPGWPFKDIREAITRRRIRKHLRSGISIYNDAFVLVSQSCDIVQPSFAAEPHVEVLRLARVESSGEDGMWRHGKHPRRLAITLEVNGETQAFVASAADRATIDRRYLTFAKADSTRQLIPEDARILSEWIANRYVRHAFPHQFNERVHKQIQSLVSRKGLRGPLRLISKILVAVEDTELEESIPYKPVFYLTMKCEDYANRDHRQSAEKVAVEMEAALSKCNGIDAIVTLTAEDGITFSELRTLRHFNLDYISLRDGGEIVR